MKESYLPLDSSETTSECQNSEYLSKEPTEFDTKTDDSSDFSFYNLGYENESQEKPPTIEPSLNFTVDAKRNGMLT